jgi:hypothetical protein
VTAFVQRRFAGEAAVDVVARRIVHAATREGCPIAVEWGSYPEIGENYWVAVLARIEKIAADPADADYDAAYELLRGEDI